MNQASVNWFDASLPRWERLQPAAGVDWKRFIRWGRLAKNLLWNRPNDPIARDGPIKRNASA